MLDGNLPSLGWSPNYPKDGYPLEGSLLLTWNLALRLNSQNKHHACDNSYGWSPNIPMMVSNQPKDGHGHPPSGSVLQTWNSALTLYSQNTM